MGIRSTTLTASILLLIPSLALANTVNTQALDLAGQQQYSQALRLLSNQSQSEKSTYEHRFLKARILSWDGQYAEARREISALMTEYPGNADLHLVLGNVEYYQGNLDAAEQQYQTVLALAPNYTDARTGLANVQRAREAQRNVSSSQRWRIDGGLSGSTFDIDEMADWNEQFLRAEYSPDKFSYHGSIQRFRRFSETDVVFQAGIADAVRGGWDWGVEVGGTPNADFRSKLRLGGRLGRTVELQNGIVLYPNVTVRYDDFSTGDIQTVLPELTTYFKNDLILTGRLIATFQNAEDDQVGWLVEGRKSVYEKLQLRAGYARAPEAVDGLAITTKSVFGGVTYAVRDNLDLHLNYVRDDREDVYIRNSANVSFTYKR